MPELPTDQRAPLTAPCSHCNATGFNRIWGCGSLMTGGVVHRSRKCFEDSGDLEIVKRMAKHVESIQKPGPGLTAEQLIEASKRSHPDA